MKIQNVYNRIIKVSGIIETIYIGTHMMVPCYYEIRDLEVVATDLDLGNITKSSLQILCPYLSVVSELVEAHKKMERTTVIIIPRLKDLEGKVYFYHHEIEK